MIIHRYLSDKLTLFKNNHDGFNKKLTIVIFSLLVFVVVFRAPNILLEPRFWAEEALYFSHALHSNIIEGIFFSPKNTAGYFLLAASFPTTFAAHFSTVELAPLITTYFSFFILLLVFYFVLWGDSYFWRSIKQRALACMIILFFPTANSSGEIWLNSINLQVYCGLIALIIVLENTTTLSQYKKWLFRSLVLFCAFSGVYAIFLSPIYYIKYYYERSRESFIHLLIISFGAATQVSVYLFIKYSGLISAKKLILFSWSKSSLYVLKYQIMLPLFGDEFGSHVFRSIGLAGALRNGSELNLQYLLLAGLVSLVIIVTIMAKLLIKRVNYINSVLVFSFVLLAILTSLFSMHGVPSGRYAVLPSIVFGFLLLNIVTGDEFSKKIKYILAIVLACSLTMGMYEYQFDTKAIFTGSNLPRPDWESQIEKWHKDPDINLTMWPYPRWKARLPSPSIINSLKQEFDSTKVINLESHPKWSEKIIKVKGVPRHFSFQFDIRTINYDEKSVMHVLLSSGNKNKLRWISIDLSNIVPKQRFTVTIDSKQFKNVGTLKMSNVNEIIFRLKGEEGATTLMLDNFKYRSPYSALL